MIRLILRVLLLIALASVAAGTLTAPSNASTNGSRAGVSNHH